MIEHVLEIGDVPLFGKFQGVDRFQKDPLGMRSYGGNIRSRHVHRECEMLVVRFVAEKINNHCSLPSTKHWNVVGAFSFLGSWRRLSLREFDHDQRADRISFASGMRPLALPTGP